MVRSVRTAVIRGELARVWEVVTLVEAYPVWRRDVGRVEVLDAGRFVEYTEKGYATTFTTTQRREGFCWVFLMENRGMTGRWEGLFAAGGPGKTLVRFTEEVQAKGKLPRLVLKGYLRRQQGRFLADLKKAVRG